jgi:chromosome partitioning protein
MIILCTHHKGGVGKTELAVHVAGALRKKLAQTLLIDCDGQASSWYFYCGKSPESKNQVRPVDDHLSVIWNPERVRIKTLAEVAETYDHFVLDIDTPLEKTVQTVLQNDPHLILIPVNLQHDALTQLPDPLAVIAALEAKVGQAPKVRIVPLGAKVADIRERLQQTAIQLNDCRIAPKVRNLLKETNLARKERRYVWEYPGCEDLEEYYQELLIN